MDEARRASERQGDGAAWWIASLRAGAVSRADLELAAWVGDEDARQALGPSVLAPATPPDLARCVRGLDRFGLPTLVRALWSAAERHIGPLEAQSPAVLAAVREGVLAWCDGPSDTSVARVDPWLDRLHEDPRVTEAPSFEAFSGFVFDALFRMGSPGPWFADRRDRDPRRELGFWNLSRLDRPGETELRDTLGQLARRGQTLAWEGRSELPARPCPAPDPPPVEEARLSALGPPELELAAWLGEPTARRLLGQSALCRWPGRNGYPLGMLHHEELVVSDVLAWLQALDLWGTPWGDLALRALARVATRSLASRPHTHAWALRLLDAADERTDPVALRALMEETAFTPVLVGEPPGRPPEAELVEEAVGLVAGTSRWSEHQWRSRRSSAVRALRDHLGDVVEAVRRALLSRLLAPRQASSSI